MLQGSGLCGVEFLMQKALNVLGMQQSYFKIETNLYDDHKVNIKPKLSL